MEYNHYLRTKYLKFRPDVILQGGSTTTNPTPQSGHVVGHVLQNVIIGGGMMTRRVPVVIGAHTPAGHPTGFVPPVTLLGGGGVHTPAGHPTGFVPPVTLLGGGAHTPAGHPTKLAQLPIQRDWRSCGTIVIDDSYRRRNGKTGQAIFLGLNPCTGMWELFHGKRDRHDASEEATAARETREETGNMFVFSHRVYADNCKVSSRNAHHHAFVVRVCAPRGGLHRSVFAKNRAILKKNNAPGKWRELTDMTRIDITDAINANILAHTVGEFKMCDVYGNPITIFSRDAEFIASALRKGMHASANVHQLSFIGSWDDSRASGHKMFLNGTSCYRA